MHRLDDLLLDVVQRGVVDLQDARLRASDKSMFEGNSR